MSRDERLQMVDWERRELPIRTQAELLGLNRSGLYYKPKPPSGEELALKRSIDEIFTEHPYYGSRRITAALRRRALTLIARPSNATCARWAWRRCIPAPT